MTTYEQGNTVDIPSLTVYCSASGLAGLEQGYI